MPFVDSFKKIIFKINEENFDSFCLEVFNYQYASCAVYHEYCKNLGKNSSNVKEPDQIPFLPIELFKNHAIKSGTWEEEKIFESSGTTNTGKSKHYIRDLAFYQHLTKEAFEIHFGPLSDFQILALLPSYLDSKNSSLIEMVNSFMSKSANGSAYFKSGDDEFHKKLKDENQKKLLIGVSFALLDYSEMNTQSAENLLIMETGGMKGRRKELTREELHQVIKVAFGQTDIYSEYGMTELMSQAYGKNGNFKFPTWAKVLIRDVNDPFNYVKNGQTGGINVIDLGNIDTCAFIETKDLGNLTGESFEVLGRFDNSDIRGCNLLI